MTDKPPHVYVILGNAPWDFADCQTALSPRPGAHDLAALHERPRTS